MLFELLRIKDYKGFLQFIETGVYIYDQLKDYKKVTNEYFNIDISDFPDDFIDTEEFLRSPINVKLKVYKLYKQNGEDTIVQLENLFNDFMNDLSNIEHVNDVDIDLFVDFTENDLFEDRYFTMMSKLSDHDYYDILEFTRNVFLKLSIDRQKELISSCMKSNVDLCVDYRNKIGKAIYRSSFVELLKYKSDIKNITMEDNKILIEMKRGNIIAIAIPRYVKNAQKYIDDIFQEDPETGGGKS